MTQNPAPTPKIRIMIVHSQSVIRAGLRSALGGAGPFEVVAEAGDGIAALLALRQHNPAVTILEMAGGTSAIAEETMLRLRAENPDLHFLIYMSPDNTLAASELFANGAYGFIFQSADSGEIMTAVRAVTSGGTYIPAQLTRALISAGKSVLKGNAYDLTHREAEILAFIGEGMSNKEIANRLDVSVRTVETHRLSIRRKTSANTLSDLVRAARRVARQDEQGSAEKAV